MTQPPYGGPGQPPSGPPPQRDPWHQPASPPPYGGQPTPSYGEPLPPAQPYGQPVPQYGDPAAPYGQPAPDPSWPGQPGQQLPAQPASGQPFGQPGPPYPGAEFGQPGFPPGQPGYPPYEAPPAPSKKKRGLLIVSLVLAFVLVACGGGGVGAYLLLRDAENGEGAAEPVVAVEGFLEAVYRDKDADKAAELVCSEARDRAAITKKIAEIEKYATTYKTPRFRWEKPKVDEQNDERAVVSVDLTMITGDEQTAEQKLTFTVVQKTGWWVCEVG